MTLYRNFQFQTILDFGYGQEFLDHLKPEDDPLADVDAFYDFESLRSTLEKAIQEFGNAERKSAAGRAAWDPVFIYKCLFVQTRFNLSFKKCHVLLLTNLMIQRFLGIVRPDQVPAWQTLWKYSKIFDKLGTFESIQKDFAQGHIENQMARIKQLCYSMDGSFAVAPIQHVTAYEREEIKAGRGDSLWLDNPHKKCHKDIDAAWATKNDQHFFGYKLNACVDLVSKIIVDLHVTPANVHDAKGCIPLIDRLPQNNKINPNVPPEYDWQRPLMIADAGYVGASIHNAILDRGWLPVICAKGTRSKELTDTQKQSNKEISTVRSRIEHIFGFMEGTMNGLVIRCIGLKRATALIHHMAHVYNVCRVCRQLARAGLQT